jgi:hypothetical protein
MKRVPLHVSEVRPRKDKRGVDLISDVLPFGRLWYAQPNAIANAYTQSGRPRGTATLLFQLREDRDALLANSSNTAGAYPTRQDLRPATSLLHHHQERHCHHLQREPSRRGHVPRGRLEES